jgi:hypothetical protein
MHPNLLVLQLHVAAALRTLTSQATGLLHQAAAGRERGQSTAEYALVLLGAATVAIVFLAWAGKTSRIGKLFDAVLDTVIGKV